MWSRILIVQFSFGHIAQIIANRLYFGSFHELPKNDNETVHFKIDDHVNYHAFYDDFGPLNLAELHRACEIIRTLLKVGFEKFELKNLRDKLHTFVFPCQMDAKNERAFCIKFAS